MAARLLSFLLGVLLLGVGWAIVVPNGFAGVTLPPLDLGLFEGHRPFIGWGAVALGLVSLLSSVLPRDGGPGGGKRRTTPVVDFDATPEPSAVDEGVAGSEGVKAVANPGPPPTASAPPEPSPEPESAPILPPPTPLPRTEHVADTGFGDMRERLRTLVRDEQWSQAAALARRLPASAVSDEERMLASQDLGDFYRSQGVTDEAAEAYGMALGYARKLASEAPSDPVRMASLAGVLTGVGDAAQDEARLDAAVEAYEEALEIRRQLAARDGTDTARRALSLALERLGDVREDRGHRVRALDLYRESFDIAGKLAAADPQAYGEDLAITRQRLSELEARVSA